MGLFGKLFGTEKSKESDCCNVEIKEVKEEETAEASSCCGSSDEK